MTDQRPDIHDMLEELCAPHTTHHPYTHEHTTTAGLTIQTQARHATVNPALIDQLRESVGQSATTEGGARPGFGSKPTARIEAIDTHTQIDMAAAKWVRDLGEDDPGDTIACIRKLAGLLPSAQPATRHAAERDIGRWWAWARIVTGWDSPAWKPNNTCPLCSERGTLRVKLAHHTALCTGCYGTWTPDNIALLADHICWENREGEAA